MTNLTLKNDLPKITLTFRELKGISQRELATQTGVSEGTISKIEKGETDGISERLLRKVFNKVGEDKSSIVFDTRDFKSVAKLCESAAKNHFMIGLLADTGMGKTTAIVNYSLRKNVFYVAYDKTMKPKQFFVSLLREMGISFEGSIHEMVNRISDELNSLHNPLVIIDEAGKLVHTMILYLQVLRDRTIKNCGIVLAGMPYFKNNLIKFSNKEKEGFAEFYRRVNIWHSLSGLTRGEIEYICKANGLSDEDEIREMQRHKRFGDLSNALLLYKIETEE